MSKIKVMVIDDSAVVRQVITQILSADPALEVIGAHADPVFAMRAMSSDWPDVITLDIEMPRMDGITFLKKLMSERPTPVVVCSTLTGKGAPTTIEALRCGAVEVVEKPGTGVRDAMRQQAGSLVQIVKAAARANVRPLVFRAEARSTAGADIGHAIAAETGHLATEERGPARAMSETTDRIVAIGTSTGGTLALEQVLSGLAPTVPGMVIVQHMPEAFTLAFAERLDKSCAIRVKQAEDGDRVLPGQALIAPGGRHLQVRRRGAFYYAEVRDGPPVSRHRPSVNVLFSSVAQAAGRNALGVIMTGMGDDGARGLLEMRQAGATTFAQDEASCVVFGMPKEAIKLGGATHTVPLHDIPDVVSGRWRKAR